MPVALITGASRGLGRAIAGSLAAHGWSLILDARSGAALNEALNEALDGLEGAGRWAAAGDRPAGRPGGRATGQVRALSGDVTDESHRAALADLVAELGGLDLLVNNASMLGPSPQPRLATYPLDVLRRVYETNVLAPLALVQRTLPWLSAGVGGTIVSVTSDAAVEPYDGWGGYGSSKAALDQVTNVLGAEHPRLRVYAFDPGDMRTDMHQAAFPGQDISDRPLPETVVPALLRLLEQRPPSGRYRAADLVHDGGEAEPGGALPSDATGEPT